ncbi:MAG: serine hydrolase [Lachnospiraceae bacterium]|nr:serine hydrolase [Lachnospiraceae bacterium]
MKCTSKKKKINCIVTILLTASFILTGCSSEVKQQYSLMSRAQQYDFIKEDKSELMASDLCPYVENSSGADDNKSVYAAGAFNDTTGETKYSQNLLEKIYPASTTKILTALVAIQNGNLNQLCTVEASDLDLPAGSSVAHLKEGDKLSLEDLLKGMLLESGNDAAKAVARSVAGSEDKFADMMNQTAKAIGASHSHFVNPDGLPDDNHYTCAYDMYVIFHNALKEKTFRNIIQAKKLDATVTDKEGNSSVVTYKSTNLYFTGHIKAPDGIKVLGGKTGTTNAAGYCLVLLSKSRKTNQEIITVVFKADTRYNLYLMTNKLLTSFGSV